MENQQSYAVFWFRRDLRLNDNHGLFEALKSGLPVQPVFIFDKAILDKLSNPADRRLAFIFSALKAIQQGLRRQESDIRCFYGFPEDAFCQLISEGGIKAVYTNHDYEAYAQGRDEKVELLLRQNGIAFHHFRDQVIFEKEEVLSGQGQPYTVFTPYGKRWRALLNEERYRSFPSELMGHAFQKCKAMELPDPAVMGFSDLEIIELRVPEISADLLSNYAERRDFPSLPATSRLSVHLRFGTISIRHCVQLGLMHSDSWLNELIWREFYMQILWNFPHVGKGKSFKPAYERIQWRNNPDEFQRWCDGKTGYAIVDAGMRELNSTGFMHNRVRMITASFLIKHLLIDWRWGEAYFAEKLLDFDLAANNGGWQWAAGSGCDAAPYFRVFNPILQTQKFDKKMAYIKKWVPEYNSLSYLQNAVVVHEFARERVLRVYKEALASSE
jgi:deoxyribodipyrimidine photo-lyase